LKIGPVDPDIICIKCLFLKKEINARRTYSPFGGQAERAKKTRLLRTVGMTIEGKRLHGRENGCLNRWVWITDDSGIWREVDSDVSDVVRIELQRLLCRHNGRLHWVN